MFRSTLFALTISAFAVMTFAAPSKVKRDDDDGHGNDDDSLIHLNDIGLINLDEVLKDADVLNDLNILSSGGDDHDDHH